MLGGRSCLFRVKDQISALAVALPGEPRTLLFAGSFRILHTVYVAKPYKKRVLG